MTDLSAEAAVTHLIAERDALAADLRDAQERLMAFEHFTMSILAENNPYFDDLADRWLAPEDYQRIMDGFNE